LARGLRFPRRADGDRQGGGAALTTPDPVRPLSSIQALRGLAALSVVVFHAFQWVGDRFWIGAAGVDVFFVVSGYVIWTVVARGERHPGGFFWRRLTRVAPAYWLVTLGVAALALAWPKLLPTVSLSPRHLALSLAFIQHTDPRGTVFPLLPPGWSLNYEAVFYSLVALALFAPAPLRFRLAASGLLGVALFGFIDPPAYELGANPMMLQFAAGAWLAHRAVPGRMPVRAGLALAAAGVAALAGLWLAGLDSDLFRPALWGVPAVAIVAGALAAEPVFARWTPRALLALGDASYAIYLCHFVTVALAAWALGSAPAWRFVAAAVALSLLAGLVFHRLVERPLIAVARALPGLAARWDFVHARWRKVRGHAVGQP
jgi:exopolysaccharide production protein ExoZ